ncbi:hypothetical protein OHA27_34535 [Streptomyces sp. NBC_01619]|uniref:hypothetical protein n=1 Tax=Streptomyces sp. NBC_01619 TaxID=2975901 RepID=UPI00224FE6B9|nr:hypothetical protein [Streptomyces sp. NBC_01619]MCX4515350.1 hypothetical protein [Streptomyces sp. NBC_01619]
MRKLTKRISLAAASAAVASGAVLGAGGTASAAVPESAHVQRPTVGVKTDDHRGDGVAYRHDSEVDYRWDGYNTRHHSDCYANSDQYDRRGHFNYWDDEDCGWKHDRSYRYDWDRNDRDSNRSDRDWERNDRDSNRSDRGRDNR